MIAYIVLLLPHDWMIKWWSEGELLILEKDCWSTTKLIQTSFHPNLWTCIARATTLTGHLTSSLHLPHVQWLARICPLLWWCMAQSIKLILFHSLHSHGCEWSPFLFLVLTQNEQQVHREEIFAEFGSWVRIEDKYLNNDVYETPLKYCKIIFLCYQLDFLLTAPYGYLVKCNQQASLCEHKHDPITNLFSQFLHSLLKIVLLLFLLQLLFINLKPLFNLIQRGAFHSHRHPQVPLVCTRGDEWIIFCGIHCIWGKSN